MMQIHQQGIFFQLQGKNVSQKILSFILLVINILMPLLIFITHLVIACSYSVVFYHLLVIGYWLFYYVLCLA